MGKWVLASPTEWLWESEQMRWRRAFSGKPEQVQAARHLVRALFADAECADVVEFAVSELAANTLRHTRSGEDGGWFGVELVYDDPVYVAVTDMGGGAVPSVRVPSDELLEHGRGLYALSQLTLSLGIHGSPALGHTVWVDIDLHQSLEAPLAIGTSRAS